MGGLTKNTSHVNLDSSEVQALIALPEAGSTDLAARKAQNALCFHYDICYDMQGQPKSQEAPRKPKPSYEEMVAKLNAASAYPNPSDSYITISYTLIQAKAQTNLRIVDNLGRQVEMRNLGEVYEGQQLIDTRKLSNGMYFFQITQEGKKVHEGKFVVTH